MSGFAGEVTGWGGRFWDPDIHVDRALQQAGEDLTFPSRAAALAHLDSLPPGDTDYAVIDQGDGQVTIHPIQGDFKPGVPASVHLTTTGARHEGEAVAVVFRDRTGNLHQTRQRQQTITADGAGPVRERTSLTDFGHGMQALRHVGDGLQGGTMGSQQTDGSPSETWRIVDP